MSSNFINVTKVKSLYLHHSTDPGSPAHTNNKHISPQQWWCERVNDCAEPVKWTCNDVSKGLINVCKWTNDPHLSLTNQKAVLHNVMRLFPDKSESSFTYTSCSCDVNAVFTICDPCVFSLLKSMTHFVSFVNDVLWKIKMQTLLILSYYLCCVFMCVGESADNTHILMKNRTLGPWSLQDEEEGQKNQCMLIRQPHVLHYTFTQTMFLFVCYQRDMTHFCQSNLPRQAAEAT